MSFLEKNLEQIIYETPNEQLRKRGLILNGKKIRQLKIGNYGIADLITYRKETFRIPILQINVLELKKGQIDVNTFLQAIRYCKGISDYMLEERKTEIEFSFDITLIGSSIELNSSFVYLSEMFSAYYPPSGCVGNINLVTYKYNFDGISFHYESNYSLINKGF